MEALHTYICFLIIIGGYFVAFSSHPINSVVSLIITFCNAAIVLFFFNIDFLGILFIIIYVGAIAVLFLFVIMMLNIKSREVTGLSANLIVKSSLIFISYHIILFMCLGFFSDIFSPNVISGINDATDIVLYLDYLNNIEILGQVLFNYTYVCVLIAGLILLVALIGAIVLTLNFNTSQTTQLATKQLSRSSNILVFRK